MSAAKEYRYNRLTWPEMNEAIGMQKLVILPTGSTGQHGRICRWTSTCFSANRSASKSAAAVPSRCSCCRRLPTG